MDLQDFHANNGGFQIKAGTSNSHAADPVQLRSVQFYNGNFILHAALQVIYGIDRNQLRQFQNAIDAVHEMELPQLISVNAVNDLESRMQNEIAVTGRDPPRVNWKCRL